MCLLDIHTFYTQTDIRMSYVRMSYSPSFVKTDDDEHPPISSSTNHAYQTYQKQKHVR